MGNLIYLIKLISVEFQVILMGHGIGGLSVIHAMHEFVDRVKQAIFVAAAMLPFGLQTDEDKKDVMFPDFSFCCPEAYAT
jgi:predicted alpha/beta hydrolase family esterase